MHPSILHFFFDQNGRLLPFLSGAWLHPLNSIVCVSPLSDWSFRSDNDRAWRLAGQTRILVTRSASFGHGLEDIAFSSMDAENYVETGGVSCLGEPKLLYIRCVATLIITTLTLNVPCQQQPDRAPHPSPQRGMAELHGKPRQAFPLPLRRPALLQRHAVRVLCG